MKHSLFLYILSSILIIHQTTYTMWTQEELGPIEKEIFLSSVVKKIGKEKTLEKIHNIGIIEYNSKISSTIYFACFRIITKFYSSANTPLALAIRKIIEEREKEYNPQDQLEEQIMTNYLRKWTIHPKYLPLGEKFTPTVKPIPNDIENFTKYYRKTDEIGDYIELQSNFNSKEALLNALENK